VTSVPAPQSSLTPAKATPSTSNYMTVPPPGPLPPEKVPGQAPIPTLPPQGANPVE
jgi:hypothetical protein